MGNNQSAAVQLNGAELSEPERRALRDAMGSFGTGVTVVTARCSDGHLAGVTANSFNSVSLDPPLVLWSLGKRSGSWQVFDDADYFCVNILSAEQRELSNHFAKTGDNKFDDVEFSDGIGGCPLLPGVTSRFQCSKHAVVDGGDHWILIGRVEHFEDFRLPALGYFRGGYVAFQ